MNLCRRKKYMKIFKQYIKDAIIDTVTDNYSNGFVRMKETLKQVQTIDLSGNILGQVTRPSDRKGICHQLVNDTKIRWVKNNE